MDAVHLSEQNDPSHNGTWVRLADVEDEMSRMAERIADLEVDLANERQRRERAEARSAHWLRQAAWANGSVLPGDDVVIVPEDPSPETAVEPRRSWWRRWRQ